MGSHKAFDANRIAQSLAILDAWRASALPLRAFATQHHHKYGQLRAWLRHEPRWRGATQPKIAVPALMPAPAGSHGETFQRVRITPKVATPDAPHRLSPSTIRIECASGDTQRTASVHFPLADTKISAQWLAAFMSA